MFDNIFNGWPNVVRQYCWTTLPNISPQKLLGHHCHTVRSMLSHIDTMFFMIFNIVLKNGKMLPQYCLVNVVCCQKSTNLTLYQLCGQHCATLSFCNDNVAATFWQYKMLPGLRRWNEFQIFPLFNLDGVNWMIGGRVNLQR